MKITIFALAGLAAAYLGVRLGGAWRNQNEIAHAQQRLRAEAPSAGKVIRHAELRTANLPPIVLRYLERALPDGMAVPRLASLRQEGGFRLRAGAPFMAMQAEQLFSVQHVAWEGHERRAGVEIPTLGTVSWGLPEGSLDYGRFLITHMTFTD